MDRDRLKLILKNLKSLVSALESEIYSDPDSYIQLQQGGPQFGFKYDQGDDDDGYPD